MLDLEYEFLRTQPTCHEDQKMVSDWHRHSRFVPVYELRLNRDLSNSKTIRTLKRHILQMWLCLP